MTRIALLFLLACCLLPCSPSHAEESPEALSPMLRMAEVDGAEIYRLDHAAAVASDALKRLDSAKADTRAKGWITEDNGETIVVTFYGYDGDSAPKALYVVTVNSAGVVIGLPKVLDPAEPLSEQQAAQVAARELARKTEIVACGSIYNAVALPRTDGDRRTWSIYMLVGTTKPDIIPAGGNYRVDTDASGTSVLAKRGFTKTCLELHGNADPRIKALMLTHLMDATPTEIHVYLNLLAGKPLYVMTTENSYIWHIENGKIRFVPR